MEPSAYRIRVSDAEKSVRPYSVTAAECKPAMVKEEPEWGECGVSEAAAAEGLYAGHEIKDELVIGPELIEQQDIAFSMQNVLSRAEDDACKLQPAGEAAPATQSTRAQADVATRQHTHTGQKPHSCDVCHKGFPQQDQLTSHLRISCASRKTYSCNTCNKQFTNKTRLTNHVRIHTDEKPYSCNVCNKLFAQRSSMTRHKRTHTGEKLYSCDICNKRVTKKSSLIDHMRIHTGEKPYSCDICNKRFTQRGIMTKHKFTHTGEKPYSCNVCDKRFAQRTSVTRHKRTHTGEKLQLQCM